MHVQMIVTFNKAHAKTSQQATRYVYATISPDSYSEKPLKFRGCQMDFITVWDDPQIVDHALYEEHLQAREGEADNRGSSFISFADLDEECVSQRFIGAKWLVPVWYHL